MTTMMNEPGTHAVRGRRLLSMERKPSARGAIITLGGVLYILVTLFLAIGAVNAQNNLLFWLFGASIALLVGSGFLSGNAMMRLRVLPQPVSDARAGEKHPIRYEIQSTSRLFPLFGVLIYEQTIHDGARQSTPGLVSHLAPGQRASSQGWIEIDRRGRHTLDAFRLESSFPFGIIRKWIRFDHTRSFVAAPHALDLRPRLVEDGSAWSGDRSSQQRNGTGTDYFGLRQYAHGDSRRKIAWKQSARRGDLISVESAHEGAPRLTIWVRTTEDPDDLILIERAIALASSIARQAIESKIAIGLWIPCKSIRIKPAHGRGQLSKIDRTLAEIDFSDLEQVEDHAPMRNAGQLIQICCTSAVDADPGVRFVAEDPDAWLAHGASLPVALEYEGGSR